MRSPSIAAAAQTYKSSAGDLTVETVASGLANPWAIAFLPDGRMLVTERPGRLRIVATDGKLSPPLPGVPKVFASGQGGLHDVMLDRNFAQNQTIYFCFAEPHEAAAAAPSMARARLAGDRLDDVKVIFRQEGPPSSGQHFGCRIVQTPDNNLFLTMGDHGSHPQGGAEPRQPHRQDRARRRPTARCRRTIRSSAATTPSRKSGATATATCRARRCIRRPASCGRTSTARTAATRSTSSRPARTTAGR